MVGDQVARKIKELGGDNIVLISAYDLDDNMLSDLIVGKYITQVLTKPISLQILKDKIGQIMARENKGLLIGEAISRQDYKRIVRLIKEIPEVNKIITIRTMHLAPKDVLVTIEVNLIDGLDTEKIETVIDNIERKVKQAIPYVNPAKVFVELEKDRVSDLYKRKGSR